MGATHSHVCRAHSLFWKPCDFIRGMLSSIWRTERAEIGPWESDKCSDFKFAYQHDPCNTTLGLVARLCRKSAITPANTSDPQLVALQLSPITKFSICTAHEWSKVCATVISWSPLG